MAITEDEIELIGVSSISPSLSSVIWIGADFLLDLVVIILIDFDFDLVFCRRADFDRLFFFFFFLLIVVESMMMIFVLLMVFSCSCSSAESPMDIISVDGGFGFVGGGLFWLSSMSEFNSLLVLVFLLAVDFDLFLLLRDLRVRFVAIVYFSWNLRLWILSTFKRHGLSEGSSEITRVFLKSHQTSFNISALIRVCCW